MASNDTPIILGPHKPTIVAITESIHYFKGFKDSHKGLDETGHYVIPVSGKYVIQIFEGGEFREFNLVCGSVIQDPIMVVRIG